MPDDPQNAPGEPPQPTSQRCGNCGAILPIAVRLCSNCGAQMPGPPAGTTPGVPWPPPQPGIPWPPSPQGPYGPGTPPIKLVTGNVKGDIALGIVAGFFGGIVGVFTIGLGLILMIAFYFNLRPTRPYFARGMAYGLAIVIFLMLAPCLFCLAGMFSYALPPWLRHLLHMQG